jgi:hypothetical protein
MHFAIQIGHASVGAMARHISGGYAAHFRRRHGGTGSVFNHYIAIPIDADLFLDDLVIWLHRPPESGKAAGVSANICWTGDLAYLSPKSSTWISTERVLAALSPGGAGRSAYIRRKTQPMAPEVMAILTGHAPRESRRSSGDVCTRPSTTRPGAPERSNIEPIARFVAQYCHVAYEDMHSPSRKRVMSKARAIAAVLCARSGLSVAAVARLFRRSRSTLIERAERYREIQPELFTRAEQALEAHWEKEAGVHGRHSVRYPKNILAAKPPSLLAGRHTPVQSRTT